jgi:hypothetical protein
MAIWVNLNRAAKFPEVCKVYKRAGRGQGAGGTSGGTGSNSPKSAIAGFLMTVKRAVNESNGAALPSWIRKAPGVANSGIGNDWQNTQVDVTAIPGVRPLMVNGKPQGFAPL